MNTLRNVFVACLLAVSLAALGGCGGPSEASRPPAERQLTVLLVEYKGPEAKASAARIAKELRDQGLPDVFTVEGAGLSSVCAGHYTCGSSRRPTRC